MTKLYEADFQHYAEMYNCIGKQEFYRRLKEEGIETPSGVLQRMKKKKGLEYDETLDQFHVLTDNDGITANNEEADIMAVNEAEMMGSEEKNRDEQEVNEEKKEDYAVQMECRALKNKKDAKRMELMNKLLSDRLLEMDQYLTVDREVKMVRLDKEAITRDGYRLVIL